MDGERMREFEWFENSRREGEEEDSKEGEWRDEENEEKKKSGGHHHSHHDFYLLQQLGNSGFQQHGFVLQCTTPLLGWQQSEAQALTLSRIGGVRRHSDRLLTAVSARTKRTCCDATPRPLISKQRKKSKKEFRLPLSLLKLLVMSLLPRRPLIFSLLLRPSSGSPAAALSRRAFSLNKNPFLVRLSSLTFFLFALSISGKSPRVAVGVVVRWIFLN